jgi:endonuclease/exonuclease/phosphatase family metal-dependent hydrolase
LQPSTFFSHVPAFEIDVATFLPECSSCFTDCSHGHGDTLVTMMRLATFNIESLDLGPEMDVPFADRIAVLRPALQHIAADILCLQEVNGQHVAGAPERRLVALDMLLQGTRYETYQRAATTGPSGRGAASVHNLVTLSRFPIRQQRQVRHEHVKPVLHKYLTGTAKANEPAPIEFDRPLLLTELELPGGEGLHLINLHLRAARASSVPGEKLRSSQWRTTSGWAEGYFLSALKRSAQALELRLLLDDIFARNPRSLIAVAGDFNAEDHETPLELAVATPEETGNAALASQSLMVLDRHIPVTRRWSVLHRGQPKMLDHILASQMLSSRLRNIEVHNEPLRAAAAGDARTTGNRGSSHAPLVADFAGDETTLAGASRQAS